MADNPIVIYRARTAPEAELIKARLAEQGIKALVTNDLLEGGRGVDLLGWPTDARVVVGEADAERARQIALEFEAEQGHRREQPLEEIAGGEWAWPVCPECDSQRTTTCPGCGRSGTDFGPGDLAPHAAAEDRAEDDQTQVLICPTCDEPFVPKYLPRCEWCGHVFEPGAADLEAGEPEHDESTDLRILAAIGIIVVLAACVAFYVWWLFA